MRLPFSLISEWHVAIACMIGESNGSCVGSATISFNPVPRLSTTPFKSKLPSVNVPVLKKKKLQNLCLSYTREHVHNVYG